MARSDETIVRAVTFNVTSPIYEKFKLKCYDEGYSMQVALTLLMEYYSTDKLTFNDDK